MRFLVGIGVFLCIPLFIVAGFTILRLSHGNPPCTMDAKMCPDGSVVGRTGPYCEFAACPAAPAVTDFTTCVAAGNPVMESYPRQCAAGGRTYVETIR